MSKDRLKKKESSDEGEGDTPVPIPNTEVKPFSADGTWLETTWESKTSPDFFMRLFLNKCLLEGGIRCILIKMVQRKQ